MEGKFEGRRKSSVKGLARGDRVDVVRHQDNLKLEGKFEGKVLETAATKGDRAAIKKYEDNLKLEGSTEYKRDELAVIGERATIVKHLDNLQVEGSFEGRAVNNVALVGERAYVIRHEDNLKVEGKFEGRKLEEVAFIGERVQVKKHQVINKTKIHLNGQFYSFSAFFKGQPHSGRRASSEKKSGMCLVCNRFQPLEITLF